MNVPDTHLEESALGERVKELSCLYSIAQISGRPAASLDEVLEEVVNMLPSAWRFPDLATARVVLDGRGFSSHSRGGQTDPGRPPRW